LIQQPLHGLGASRDERLAGIVVDVEGGAVRHAPGGTPDGVYQAKAGRDIP